VGRIHVDHTSETQIEVILILFKSLGRLSSRGCVLLGHSNGLLSLKSHGGDIIVELGLVLLNDHKLVDFLSIVDLDVGVESHGSGITEPLRDISALSLRPPLEGGTARSRISLILIDECLGWREVIWKRSGPTSQRLLLLNLGALSL
jgi:hypothetical protein